jgi:cytochrome P450
MGPTSALAIARRFDEISLSSTEFWNRTAAGREEAFAVLRDKRPVSWQPPVQDNWMPDADDIGYWAVVRHADVVTVSRHNDIFASGQGVLFENLPPDVLRASQSILAMDPPDHTTIRKLIAAAFTARQISRIQAQIAANARTIVDSIVEKGAVDLVHEVSAVMPMRTVCDMIGIERSEQPNVARAAEVITGWNDPDVRGGRERGPALAEAGLYLNGLVYQLSQRRRREPQNDLITALVQAEVDGEHLARVDISAFFTLLSVAGTDTTRHTLSYAIKALTDFPEQRAWLLEDIDARIDSATDEFVRWATPVMTFKRTCVQDTDLGGQQIRAGQKVCMFYASANWDRDVFERPEQLELSRSPNPHVGFGGGGAHHCLGHQLAKSQIRALLRELLTRLPDIEAHEPVLLAGSNFINGIKSMKVTFTPVT